VLYCIPQSIPYLIIKTFISKTTSFIDKESVHNNKPLFNDPSPPNSMSYRNRCNVVVYTRFNNLYSINIKIFMQFCNTRHRSCRNFKPKVVFLPLHLIILNLG